MKILHTTTDLSEVEGAVQLGDLELLGHNPVKEFSSTEELSNDHQLIPTLESSVEPHYLGVADLLQNIYFVLDFFPLISGSRPEFSHHIFVQNVLTLPTYLICLEAKDLPSSLFLT